MRFFTRTLVLVSAMAVGVNSAYAVVSGADDAPVMPSRVNIFSTPEDQDAMELYRVVYKDDSPVTGNNDDNKSGGRCSGFFGGAAGAGRSNSGNRGNGNNGRQGGYGANGERGGNGGHGNSGNSRSHASRDCAEKFSK